MNVTQKNNQTTVSYSDEDLLVLMSFREENEEEAKCAFELFYKRYGDLLWNLCLSVCSNIEYESEELAKDVFANTMSAVYYSSHTYDSKKANVKTWMSTIAKNKMRDLLKIFTETRIDEKEFENIEAKNEIEIQFTTPQQKALDKALETLSEREKDVLFTYMTFQDGRKHLPDEEIEMLCKRYDTTSQNLRKIKERAINKIKNHIIQNSDFLKTK